MLNIILNSISDCTHSIIVVISFRNNLVNFCLIVDMSPIFSLCKTDVTHWFITYLTDLERSNYQDYQGSKGQVIRSRERTKTCLLSEISGSSLVVVRMTVMSQCDISNLLLIYPNARLIYFLLYVHQDYVIVKIDKSHALHSESVYSCSYSALAY